MPFFNGSTNEELQSDAPAKVYEGVEVRTSVTRDAKEMVESSNPNNIIQGDNDKNDQLLVGTELHSPHHGGATSRQQSQTTWYRKKRWTITSFIALIIAIIVIAVPITLTKKQHSSHPSSTSSTNATTPLSTVLPSSPTATGNAKGVLKGTRFALSTSLDELSLAQFYQRDDRRIQYLQESRDFNWEAPTDETLPIDDAKAGTPLTASLANAAADTVNRTTFLYLFYVDESNIIQNVYNNVSSGAWERGSIGGMKYKVPNDPQIAFACNDGRLVNSSSAFKYDGLSLYATDSSDAQIHERLYDSVNDFWTDGQTLEDADGSGGAYAGWESDLGYAFAHGPGNSIGLYSHNGSSTRMATWSHSISPNSLEIGNHSAICGTYPTVVYQDNSGTIMGSDCSGDALDDLEWGSSYVIAGSENNVIENTSLSCWDFLGRDGIGFSVRYQTEDGSINEAYISSNSEKGDESAWKHRTVLQQ